MPVNTNSGMDYWKDNTGLDYWNEFFDCFCLFAGYISLAEYTNTYISILVIPNLKSVYDTKSMIPRIVSW